MLLTGFCLGAFDGARAIRVTFQNLPYLLLLLALLPVEITSAFVGVNTLIDSFKNFHVPVAVVGAFAWRVPGRVWRRERAQEPRR